MPGTPHRTLCQTLTSRTLYPTSQDSSGFNPTGLFDVYIVQPHQGVLRASYTITTHTCSVVHWIVTNRIRTDIDTSEQPDISPRTTKNPSHKVTRVMSHATTCVAVFMSVRMSSYSEFLHQCCPLPGTQTGISLADYLANCWSMITPNNP